MDTRHIVADDDAQKIWEWLQNRGGIKVWQSANLSNPGASWTTPADIEHKPSWQADNKPRLITDPAEVAVAIYEVFKTFHVATRMGGQGLSIKVTDGGSRRIRKELENAGEGSTYQFSYGEYDNCTILRQKELIPIADYIQRRKAQ